MSIRNEKSSTQELSLKDCEVIVVSNERQEDATSSLQQKTNLEAEGGSTCTSSSSSGDAPRD